MEGAGIGRRRSSLLRVKNSPKGGSQAPLFRCSSCPVSWREQVGISEGICFCTVRVQLGQHIGSRSLRLGQLRYQKGPSLVSSSLDTKSDVYLQGWVVDGTSSSLSNTGQGHFLGLEVDEFGDVHVTQPMGERGELGPFPQPSSGPKVLPSSQLEGHLPINCRWAICSVSWERTAPFPTLQGSEPLSYIFWMNDVLTRILEKNWDPKWKKEHITMHSLTIWTEKWRDYLPFSNTLF